MPLPFPFDWKAPDYTLVSRHRAERLAWLRADARRIALAREFYKAHPAQFISDFGVTEDPRNVERNLPTTIPFLLFPKQEEWVAWLIERWRRSEPGLTEKSREMGMSWLAMATACTLCLFNEGFAIGVGSRKEEYVDRVGSSNSLLEKCRLFIEALPPEFKGSWSRTSASAHRLIKFPATGSKIFGESGDEIGRGARASIFLVDEAAFLEHPELADAALSRTTNCRVDISTPNGLANSFANRRFSPAFADGKVFTFHWKNDPRRDARWYAQQCRVIDNPALIAAELDIDYAASQEGVLIPASWARAAVNAHAVLGIAPTGHKKAALDIADEGKDRCAVAVRRGILLRHCESWSGKGSDTLKSLVRAFAVCDSLETRYCAYDSDGIGAACRGDATEINRQREEAGRPFITVHAHRGSESPPDGTLQPPHENVDFFANMKSFCWWALRLLFQETYRVIVEGKRPYEPDKLISLSPDIPELELALSQLTQPTYSVNTPGKILVDKRPDGARSPDLADAIAMVFCPGGFDPVLWARLGGASV